MLKRAVIATISIFVAWSALDFVIHGVLLQSTYEATADLWRPMGEMKMGLMYLVTLVFVACFVAIYTLLVGSKSLATGLKYGLLFGIGSGFSMGFGTYSVMPLPLNLPFTWFFGMVVEALVAGVLVGSIIKDKDA